jgi:hypothetical protein
VRDALDAAPCSGAARGRPSPGRPDRAGATFTSLPEEPTPRSRMSVSPRSVHPEAFSLALSMHLRRPSPNLSELSVPCCAEQRCAQ